jgi:hypothetical protein
LAQLHHRYFPVLPVMKMVTAGLFSSMFKPPNRNGWHTLSPACNRYALQTHTHRRWHGRAHLRAGHGAGLPALPVALDNELAMKIHVEHPINLFLNSFAALYKPGNVRNTASPGENYIVHEVWAIWHVVSTGNKKRRF